MPVFEWQGVIRITIGELSRAAQFDLWAMYTQSEWYNDTTEDNTRNGVRLMDTDAMVTAVATRKIEVCKKGKWVEVEAGETVTVITPDSDEFPVSYPVTYQQINTAPRSLGDLWVRYGTERNGGLTANMTFFTSLTLTNGKTNSVPESAEPPLNTPTPETS